jgi:hypothetical protein
MTTKEEVEELLPPKDDKDVILQKDTSQLTDNQKPKHQERPNSVLGREDDALNFSFDEKAA